jgi:tellurium resistance protein TerD
MSDSPGPARLPLKTDISPLILPFAFEHVRNGYFEGRSIMGVNLTKGGDVNLTKAAGGELVKARIGLGWDAKGDGQPFDLDASVIGVDAAAKSAGADWFVYYNNLISPDSAIVHQGDNLTGAGDGDDEQILVDLSKVPDSVAELIVAVTIHEAAARGGQDFGQVSNAYVRVVDESNGAELARYDLSEDGAGKNSFEFGKLYRADGAWKFKALGDPVDGEMQGLVSKYQIG